MLVIAVLLLCSSVNGQLSFSSFNGDFSSFDPANSGIALSDIITVANHFGCKTWVDGKCTECSKSYYFNKNGVCCEVPPLCSQFNQAEGLCLQCYQGYTVVNNCCELASQDSGCAVWNGNVCSVCSKGWWKNANGVCQVVSDLCSTWSESTGACLSCYGGYVLNGGVCEINTNPFNGGNNLLCGTWNGTQCLKCSRRAYFNNQGICVAVSDQCATFDPLNGNCLSCYGGYSLSAGVCSKSAVSTPSDLGCKTWNSAQNVCLECSFRFFFNGTVCVPVSDQCSTWDVSGRCTLCYAGYQLVSGVCQKAAEQKVSDLGCALWNWSQQQCLQCSNNWVFNSQGVCVPVSDQCKTFNTAGNCVSCYVGYTIISGQCQLSPDQRPSDLGCATWNWTNKTCLQCSNNWVFNSQGVCTPVSDQCATFNLAGNCVTCYKGYVLNAGRCDLAPQETNPDLGCATWDWVNKVCLGCSSNWVKNAQGVCTPVSDQCATFNTAGNCLSCYKGYVLNAGKCELAPKETNPDLGCATWDWTNKICLQCSNNWVFNSQNVCVPVSDQCATFNLAGDCVTCYKGYIINAGKCVLAPTQKVSDLGCALWNWSQQQCLQCSNNWVFNSQGVCVPVSDQCKTFNTAGNCVSCYEGYLLNAGKCELAPSQKPSDLGCATWDWKKQICLQCSNNWVFNSQNVCIPVSDQCATFNLAGNCVSCYKGYVLNAGKCELAPTKQVSDLGCGTWDWDRQVCLKCSNRFVFNSQGRCVPVSDNCQTWDNSGACTACYAGFILGNGQCTQGNSLCKVSSAQGGCTSCYTGYILDNGNCVPISSLASLALYYSQCCPEKLATLTKAVGSNTAFGG
jgi:hypothetical protein